MDLPFIDKNIRLLPITQGGTMAIKNFVIELAQSVKPEATITYDFMTVDGVNIYTLMWSWIYNNTGLNSKLFFYGSESEQSLVIRIHSEMENMKLIEGVADRAEKLKRSQS